MPEFFYQAKKSPTEVVQGIITAESLREAIEKLETQGLIPISVEPKKVFSEFSLKKYRSKKLSHKDIIIFTTQLYTLIKSKVDLLRSLEILKQSATNLHLKEILEQVIKEVKEGSTLSEALAKYPKYFSGLYINIIKTGEVSGRLEESLKENLIYLNRVSDLRAKIYQALAYPSLMVGVGIITIFLLIGFIIPRLESMFEEFQQNLPFFTIFLLDLGKFLKSHFLGFLIFLMILFSFGGVLKRKFFLQLRYYLPIFKSLAYRQEIVNFFEGLSLLLRSGTPLLESLNIAIPILQERKLHYKLSKVQEEIKAGNSFSTSLSKTEIFPSILIQMIKVGEEGGRLADVFKEIAENYTREIENKIKIITALLEPVIILVLGLIIGGIVMAILLPIFNMSTLIE